MTKLLERAIARARDLTEAEQDEAAEILLWAMGDSRREDTVTFEIREFGGHAAGYDTTMRDKA